MVLCSDLIDALEKAIRIFLLYVVGHIYSLYFIDFALVWSILLAVSYGFWSFTDVSTHKQWNLSALIKYYWGVWSWCVGITVLKMEKYWLSDLSVIVIFHHHNLSNISVGQRFYNIEVLWFILYKGYVFLSIH